MEFFNKRKALQIILDKAYNRGISQAKLIEDIYDYSHFNRMCNGKEDVKIDVLVLCCLKLNISFDSVIQLSKEKALIELDEYYNQFEVIRLQRRFNEFNDLYNKITTNDAIKELRQYKQLSNHILAIIEARKNHNFKASKNLLELAFELSGFPLKQYNQYALSKEQIEILIDYSICCFSLRETKWKEILSYLKKNDKKLIDSDTFEYVYPKVMFNISEMFFLNHEYTEAMPNIDKAIQYCKDTNNFIFLPYLYYNAACCLSMLEEYEKSKEYLENGKSILILQNKLDELHQIFPKDYQEYFINNPYVTEHSLDDMIE